jgi:hypothetical protein
VQWVARDAGRWFEIKGISGEMMRLFSSRRESITADLRGRAARFEQRYGRAPSQRELAQLLLDGDRRLSQAEVTEFGPALACSHVPKGSDVGVSGRRGRRPLSRAHAWTVSRRLS